MKNFESKKLEYQALITKQPNKEILATWYDIESRAFRDRFNREKLCIKNRVLTEGDYGCIFFTFGIPPKIPAELHEWALTLTAVYCRLLPHTAV